MKQMVVTIGVRVPLYERIRIIAETEDIPSDELIDHVLRNYVETWADQDEDDEEETDEDDEEEEDTETSDQ